MAALIGGDHVDVSEKSRGLVAQDIFSETLSVLAVLAPVSTEDVAAIVRAAAVHGLHVVPRGGGISYTGGYLSPDPGRAVVLDMCRIVAVEVEPADMYAVVGAGCTWAALDAALAPHGLRAAYWGPISGVKATVGGAIGQNAIFWGAGTAGTAADTVLGLEAVTGSGAIVRTGTLGVTDATPFFRHFGPDLTGLFTSDAGALGIKTRIVLRLVKRASATAALSFMLPDHRRLAALMSAVAREQLAAQQMGLDEKLKDVRITRDGWRADLTHVRDLFRGAPSRLRGFGDVLRLMGAGRTLLDGGAFSAHVFVEGMAQPEVRAKVERIRALARDAAAREVEAAVPKMMQAKPFGALIGMMGPKGERWVPVHCIVPHSRAVAAFEAIEDVFAAQSDAMRQHGIATGYLFATIGVNGFVIEPMLTWPDALHALHHATIDAARIARYPIHVAALEARTLVADLRAAITAAVDRLGAVHIQVGRHYPHANRLDPETAGLLASIRQALDPLSTLNPGALC